jgi:hypothetical protein
MPTNLPKNRAWVRSFQPVKAWYLGYIRSPDGNNDLRERAPEQGRMSSYFKINFGNMKGQVQ